MIENIEYILKEVGGDLKDLIDITVFLVDMKDYDEFNIVYNQYFDAKSGPSRTTVNINLLRVLIFFVKGCCPSVTESQSFN